MSIVPVIAMLATVSPTITVGADLKCSQPAPRPTVYMVDGEFMEDGSEPLAGVAPENVQAMEILCMNPQDSTFTTGTGIPVISIWTKQGPVAGMRPTLAAIIDAQDAYAKQNAAYAESVHELSLPPYPGNFSITIDADADHWRASITMNGYLGTCYVFDGAGPAPTEAAMPRTPECVYGRAVPIEALRAGK